MKNVRKNFWSGAIVALLGFSVLTLTGGDCGGGSSGADGNDPSRNTNTTAGGTTKVKVQKIAKLKKDADHINHDQINRVLSSFDGKSVYFSANNDSELRALVIKDNDFVASADTAAQWATIALTGSAAANPGDRAITGANKITELSPAKAGVVVSVAGAGDMRGAFYVEGKAFSKHSWTNNQNDLGTNITNDDNIKAFVLTKNNLEHVYFVNLTNAARGVFRADISGPAAAVANSNAAKWMVANAPLTAKVKSTMVGTTAVFVDESGIRNILVTDIADGNKTVAVATGGSAFDKAKWQHGATANNDDVKAVYANGETLYIALGSTGNDSKGGVAVVDFTGAGTAKAMHADWKNKSVLNFAFDGTKVWAVLADGLIEAKNDGTLGDKLNKAAVDAKKAVTKTAGAKAGYEGDFPGANITDAKFVTDKAGKHLLVATSDTGLYMVHPEAEVVTTK